MAFGEVTHEVDYFRLHLLPLQIAIAERYKMINESRLPTNVKPTHYALVIKTDLEKLTFHGSGLIQVVVIEDTDVIVLNAGANLDLNANDISLQLRNDDDESSRGRHHWHNPLDVQRDTEKERLSFKLPFTLPKGSQLQLGLKWSSKLGETVTGYFTSPTGEHDGKKRYCSLTQFEPTAARKAFPCWDEPLLKATYALTMISWEGTVNVSNMPISSEWAYVPEVGQRLNDSEDIASDINRWKMTEFETTPLMSTYLLAFANGHFDHLQGSFESPLSGRAIPIRMYTSPSVSRQSQLCMDVVAKVMPIYEEVFHLEYPLPKLDILIVDNHTGGMENWSWWDNLWLNEGFATLMGNVVIIDRVFPEWKMDSDFISGNLSHALELDSARSSHPIEVEVNDTDQIGQIFDTLSYKKAASVLRMLSDHVGEETFLDGVARYLSKHVYGSSVTSDLWEGISEASGKDISKLMNDWITKIGFPILKVTETNNSITVRQDRFLATGDATERENQEIWHVPLSLKTIDGDGRVIVNRNLVLNEREMTIDLDTTRPFKLNSDTKGLYRTSYTVDRLIKLGEEAASTGSSFSLDDRMGLVSDAFVLAKAGFLRTGAALDLVKTLRKGMENQVWSTIMYQLHDLRNVFWEQPTDVQENLDAFARYLYKPIVDELGYEYTESDSPDIVSLRTKAIWAAARSQDSSVVAELRSRFKHFQDTGDDSKIPLDLARAVYCIAVRYGGDAEYKAVKALYLNPPTPSLKGPAILAMTATEDQGCIEDLLVFILSDALHQDVANFFLSAAANKALRRRFVSFFQENFDKFLDKYSGNFTLSSLVKGTYMGLTSESDAVAMEAFFKDKDVSKLNMVIAQTLESIRANSTWIDRSKEDVASWLKIWKEEDQSEIRA
ncbi:Aminopeptidase 2 mitochondrial [Tulasnella sp. 332]|nr:Aminopeptidase 2 mitochondrial [Tulasnella sp. 332]